MAIKQRIISEVYNDQTQEICHREIIKDKVIDSPKEIDDIGYNHPEQIELIQGIQDAFLLSQMSLLDVGQQCPHCGSPTSKAGATSCNFHSVFTDHKVSINRRKCCNKECGQYLYTSISTLFGSNLHPDLVKKQTKTCAEMSFQKAEDSLNAESSKPRTVNSHSSLNNLMDKVGSILDQIQRTYSDELLTYIKPSPHLIMQMDGGFIRDKRASMSKFEALVGKVYKPENSYQKATRKQDDSRGGISNKHYIASALKDRGVRIKEMLLAASKKEGLSKDTEITAFADGAKNCWNAIKSIKKHCKSLTMILDWWHIKFKFDKLINRFDDPDAERLEAIKWNIWHGSADKAIEALSQFYLDTITHDQSDQIHSLLKYLANNRQYLANYAGRHAKGLPFTSSVIESSIETIINERHKKKKKAQWTRQGAHNILQIRTATASDHWNETWDEAKKSFYKIAA